MALVHRGPRKPKEEPVEAPEPQQTQEQTQLPTLRELEIRHGVIQDNSRPLYATKLAVEQDKIAAELGRERRERCKKQEIAEEEAQKERIARSVEHAKQHTNVNLKFDAFGNKIVEVKPSIVLTSKPQTVEPPIWEPRKEHLNVPQQLSETAGKRYKYLSTAVDEFGVEKPLPAGAVRERIEVPPPAPAEAGYPTVHKITCPVCGEANIVVAMPFHFVNNNFSTKCFWDLPRCIERGLISKEQAAKLEAERSAVHQ